MQVLNLSLQDVEEKIHKREVKITVIGLGKMGLSLAMVFTHAGFSVNGLDITEELVSQLASGSTSIQEPIVPERLKEAVDKGLFHPTTNIKHAVSEATFIIMIIPVLTTEDGHADISIMLETYKKVNAHAPKGVIFIQESTLPPLTTSGVLKDALEINGKKSGIDFGLVFAPERTFSGRSIKDIEENYPKILGGDTENAATASKILYEQVCDKGVMQMRNATAAEAVKTFKGAYRDANIAIANELARLADLYGVDILEVIEAANSEPFSNIHRPGFGVGGHCIPVYPRFLIAGSKDMEYDANLLKVSREINDDMVDYAVSTISNYIDTWDIEILVLGLAYRGGVKEYRLSPTLRLIPKGARTLLMDPLFTIDEINSIIGDQIGAEWNPKLLSKYPIVIIVTDHAEFKNIENQLNATVIYDGRYVIDENKVGDAILLQPGRLVMK